MQVNLDTIKIPTPFGPIEFSFSKEEARRVASPKELQKGSAANADAPDGLMFRPFEFDTAVLPEGCQPFQSGKYGNFLLTEKMLEAIRGKVDGLRKDTGAPDEAALALSIYESRAFQSLCGPQMNAKLQRGSQINGWRLTDAALDKFNKLGQTEVDVTPQIVIIALSKKEFEGRLKPTAVNVLLSKYRFEVPPNADSLAFDPKTGTTLLTYSMDYQNVQLGGRTRDVTSGGFIRIFVGRSYVYVMEFSVNTVGMSPKRWRALQDYLSSFRYVGDSSAE